MKSSRKGRVTHVANHMGTVQNWERERPIMQLDQFYIYIYIYIYRIERVAVIQTSLSRDSDLTLSYFIEKNHGRLICKTWLTSAF